MDNLSHPNVPEAPETAGFEPVQSMPSPASRPRTFREVSERLTDDVTLPAKRKRELQSSLRRFLEIVGRADSLEASAVVVRTLARLKRPPHGRVAPKTWANIRSNVMFALTHTGCGSRAPAREDLAPDWRNVLESLDAHDLKGLRLRLSRFVHWASANGIAPNDVEDDTLAAFHHHLTANAVVAKPDRLYRYACKALNDAAGKVEGWPCPTVALPCFREMVSLPREQFEADFLSELDDYIELLGSPRLNHRLARRSNKQSRRGRSGPLRKATIKARHEQIRRMSSALVHSGFDIHRLRSLDQLVEVENFESAMIWYEDYLGGPKPSLEELANGMVAMAEHHLRVPEHQLDELKDIRNELRCRKPGMTDKNRERLQQLKDPMVLRQFLGLGDLLIELAGKAKSAKRAAVLVQKALMHELLVWAPMRIENLANLHMDRHFSMNDGGRKGAVRIIIPAEEVKNDVRLEYILPLPAARALDLYLRQHRPGLLGGPDEGWLFVSGERAHKHKATLQQQITATAERYAGIKINPHLYRHIAAYLYLRRNPKDVETVRRMLGHKRIETTLAFYAEFEQDIANQFYIDSVLADRFDAAGGAQ